MGGQQSEACVPRLCIVGLEEDSADVRALPDCIREARHLHEH